MHSGTIKTYFRSAWRLNFLASSCLGGSPPSPVDPPLGLAHVRCSMSVECSN